jgi:hypothetical protein
MPPLYRPPRDVLAMEIISLQMDPHLAVESC